MAGKKWLESANLRASSLLENLIALGLASLLIYIVFPIFIKLKHSRDHECFEALTALRTYRNFSWKNAELPKDTLWDGVPIIVEVNQITQNDWSVRLLVERSLHSDVYLDYWMKVINE